jgi:membrane-bound ClpP family serine protease
METFWTLLKESVILQAVLTIGIWAAVIYLIVVGKEVPEVLTMAANLVLGFYFGSKLALNRGS